MKLLIFMLNRKYWNLLKLNCKTNKCTSQDCISLAQVFVGESCSNGHDSLLSPCAPDQNPLMELIQGSVTWSYVLWRSNAMSTPPFACLVKTLVRVLLKISSCASLIMKPLKHYIAFWTAKCGHGPGFTNLRPKVT